jgi:hypothetical protein
MPSGPASTYARAVLRKALELSKPYFKVQPIAIGLMSLVWIYHKRGWPSTATEASGYFWAAIPIAIWWGLVFAWNFFRATYRLYAAQSEEIRRFSPSPDPVLPKRVYIPMQAHELVGLLRGLTTINAEKIVAEYAGKWLKVSGTVFNVSEYWKGSDEISVSLNVEGLPGLATLRFDAATWRDYLVVYTPGTPLSAAGRVRSIGMTDVTLEGCEVIATQESGPTTSSQDQT